ncbi:MAG: SRPBCC domain-containing protein [Streptosporangiaceae bacterium]
MAKEKHEIRFSREFDAPAELLYRAFTDPDQLCLWFGPYGWSVPCESVHIDARPGGFQRFVMVNDENPELRSAVNATFTEVVENQLLVGHEDVEDPETKKTERHHLRLEFHSEGDARTRLDVRQGPFTEEMGHATEEGWQSSFTDLDSLLRRSL